MKLDLISRKRTHPNPHPPSPPYPATPTSSLSTKHTHLPALSDPPHPHQRTEQLTRSLTTALHTGHFTLPAPGSPRFIMPRVSQQSCHRVSQVSHTVGAQRWGRCTEQATRWPHGIRAVLDSSWRQMTQVESGCRGSGGGGERGSERCGQRWW